MGLDYSDYGCIKMLKHLKDSGSYLELVAVVFVLSIEGGVGVDPVDSLDVLSYQR